MNVNFQILDEKGRGSIRMTWAGGRTAVITIARFVRLVPFSAFTLDEMRKKGWGCDLDLRPKAIDQLLGGF